ncbi:MULTISPECIES: hypothetical protein [Vibrio]|uniref:Proline and glycine rich transmembrane protein gene in bax n=1 Tax=Vibrio algicola TaxID=2662262 RepID=A0A5Q0TJ38_9VIBR|nr:MULTISPECIES: hypothetical protein [Vibrio]MBD1575596.1 hypothetical protein [Vibrio sp. S11_S32]
MNVDLDKEFNVGGNLTTALNGQYELKANAVIKEAWQLTIKNFLSFSPTIVLLLVLQIVIFAIALKLQLGDPSVILQLFTDPSNMAQHQNIFDAAIIANFSYEIISAPLYAGVCLMAMSHSTGFKTQPRHMLKGLQYTIPLMVMTVLALSLQGIGGMIIPFVSLYLSMAFSHAPLLICEKQMTPLKALLMSFRAVNKKILPLISIYILVLMMFFAAALFYGVGLIFVLPFYFHVKGVLYREMFGIRLKVTSGGGNNPPPSNGHKQSKVFEA